MASGVMTLDEIRRVGLHALLDALGAEGAVRFLQQFDAGRGDYTKDRDLFLNGLTVDELADRIEARRGRTGDNIEPE